MSLLICFDDSNDVKFKTDVLNEVIENRGDVAGRARTRHVSHCAARQASMSMLTGFLQILSWKQEKFNTVFMQMLFSIDWSLGALIVILDLERERPPRDLNFPARRQHSVFIFVFIVATLGVKPWAFVYALAAQVDIGLSNAAMQMKTRQTCRYAPMAQQSCPT